jgi:hypothetical protein
MTPEQKTVYIANQVKDNLWLGDIKSIKEIIDNLLWSERFASKFKNSFKQTSSLYEEVQKEAKMRYEEESFEHRLYLTKKFKERIKESSRIKEAIIGLLIIELEKLLDRLREVKLFWEIIKKPSYRYTIFEYPPKYEIRVLIDKKVEANVNELVKKLEEKGFKCSKFGGKHYVFITAYSTQSYIEIAILFPKVSINISLLTPKKEEAQKLVEMIIESLIS